MNFNIYLEDELGKQLEKIVNSTGKPRNTLVREAIKTLIQEYTTTQWSEKIKDFNGIKEGITFESYRSELVPPSDPEIFS